MINVKEDIAKVIEIQKREDKLSHAYLVETNDYEKFKIKLKTILKTLLCEESDSYCDKCQSCHYIDSSEHPNVVYLSPEGASIKVFQVDELKNRFNTKSSYARYNIYVIFEAEKLNSFSGNALLKFLEEPEDNIIGLLVTNNKSLILPTIASRCQLFSDLYEEYAYSDDIIKLANDIDSCWKSDINTVDYSKIIKEVNDKSNVKNAFNYLLNQELIKNPNLKKIAVLKEIIEKMRYNVNIDLLVLSYILRMRELK